MESMPLRLHCDSGERLESKGKRSISLSENGMVLEEHYDTVAEDPGASTTVEYNMVGDRL